MIPSRSSIIMGKRTFSPNMINQLLVNVLLGQVMFHEIIAIQREEVVLRNDRVFPQRAHTGSYDGGGVVHELFTQELSQTVLSGLQTRQSISNRQSYQIEGQEGTAPHSTQYHYHNISWSTPWLQLVWVVAPRPLPKQKLWIPPEDTSSSMVGRSQAIRRTEYTQRNEWV